MDVAQFHEIINKIDGVINVKVIEENDEISEVHILANKLRSPKQIVRDIESSLMAVYDYRIDRKVISIAQIETNETKAINRIKYEGISSQNIGTMIECSVKLSYEDEEFEVPISKVKTLVNTKKIVAEATLRSVEKIIGQTVVFDIQDILVNNNRDVSFVSVFVNIVAENSEETVIGSAIVRTDINDAIAKATLDAVNRRLQKNTY
jgi:hypothetical protein